MLSKPNSETALLFSQVIVANLKYCQIAIPTATQLVEKRIFSTPVDVPERIYAPEGWMLVDGDVVATVQSLNITPVGGDDSPFAIPPRLGPAVPMDFETVSAMPLPEPAYLHATFTCKMPGSSRSFQSVFRKAKPRYVRVYPFDRIGSLADVVKTFLKEENAFVQQYSSNLKNVPFYREQFLL